MHGKFPLEMYGNPHESEMSSGTGGTRSNWTLIAGLAVRLIEL